jgi:hypothetical protein
MPTQQVLSEHARVTSLLAQTCPRDVITPLHSSSLLLTPPHSSSLLLLTPPQSSASPPPKNKARTAPILLLIPGRAY